MLKKLAILLLMSLNVFNGLLISACTSTSSNTNSVATTATEYPIIGDDLYWSDLVYSADEISGFEGKLLFDKEILRSHYKSVFGDSDSSGFDQEYDKAVLQKQPNSRAILSALYIDKVENEAKDNNVLSMDDLKIAAYLLLEDALKNNSAISQEKIGYFLNYQEMGVINQKRAYYWMTQAANNGSSNAAYVLGKKYLEISSNDFTDQRLHSLAHQYLVNAAVAGNSNAAYELCYYYDRIEGSKKIDEQAFRWAKLAAELGHPSAMGKLANYYSIGRGTPPNKNLALFWADKGIEFNDSFSFFVKGMLLQYNFAKNQDDLFEALSYFKKGCDLGESVSCVGFRKLYNQLSRAYL